jgi:hypothetical protein
MLVFGANLIFVHIQKHSANNLQMSRTYLEKNCEWLKFYLHINFLFPLYSLSLSYF